MPAQAPFESPMRILFWSEVFWPHIGGAEIFATNLLLGLHRRGHEFVVVTRQDNPALPKQAWFNGIPVYRFPFYQALAEGNVNQLIQIRRQVIKLKTSFAPDLIHISCFGLSLLFFMETANICNAPLLVTLHGDRYPPPNGKDTLLEQILRAADWVTGPCAATVQYARQLLPNLTLPGSFIYNGVEMPSDAPTPLPMDAPRLLCLGRLSNEKGFDLALNAFASIIDRFPHARLIIAGDGPERASLEQQATRLGLSKAIDFSGWVSPEQIPALINSVSVVVMSSRREALPLVAIEAAFMARPVVAARVGGLPEVVIHDETGLLVEREDVSALTEAITALLDHPDRAQQMGAAARRRAREIFSLERCVNSYDDLYRSIAKGPSHAGCA
jgi:glycosyltransferase involved in cell wall biosynthesis